MSQIDLFGGETPIDELDLTPLQRELARRQRDLIEPLTPDEAGAILHALRGKHPEDRRCPWCAPDGHDALDRLDRARERRR